MATDNGTLSLVAFGHLMNTTTGNQGNHCVIAICQTRPAVNQGNQSLTTSAQRCHQYTAIVGKELPQLRETLSRALGTWELALGGAG